MYAHNTQVYIITVNPLVFCGHLVQIQTDRVKNCKIITQIIVILMYFPLENSGAANEDPKT